MKTRAAEESWYAVLKQQISERPRRRGQPAPGLLSDSLYFLFNHRSLRDILPSIYHTEKNFSLSAAGPVVEQEGRAGVPGMQGDDLFTRPSPSGSPHCDTWHPGDKQKRVNIHRL
ncbi:Zinc finger X-linked protein ZXDA [Dissostichus eleginoides]|uniref:Zinc finger X-linked protein ZXDA n=1 Tax=Dissostichus eleginoides TaxID=100907 RepID=A0AAD9C298_DISEL|nr:Zinc finger X-linked protein ZXDA [Dissostichus eleginoides]